MHIQASIKDVVIDYELIRRDVKNPRLEFRNKQLYLIVPHAYKDHEKVIYRHRRWIYNRYSRVQRLKELSQNIELVTDRTIGELKELIYSLITKTENELGVKPQKTSFRKMKTKWGSCSSKGNLNFNIYMKHLPDRMIEYIVFHEMVHLIELNHSQRFWDHIKARFPNYKDAETMLTAYWSLIQKQHISPYREL